MRCSLVNPFRLVCALLAAEEHRPLNQDRREREQICVFNALYEALIIARPQ